MVPIILLTGYGDLMLAAEETPPDVDRVVGKPVRLAILRTVIAAVMPALQESNGVSLQKNRL